MLEGMVYGTQRPVAGMVVQGLFYLNPPISSSTMTHINPQPQHAAEAQQKRGSAKCESFLCSETRLEPMCRIPPQVVPSASGIWDLKGDTVEMQIDMQISVGPYYMSLPSFYFVYTYVNVCVKKIFICLFAYLLIYVFIYWFTYLFIYLFIYVFIYLFINLFIYVLLYLYMYLCIYVFVYLCMNVWMYECMNVWMYECM